MVESLPAGRKARARSARRRRIASRSTTLAIATAMLVMLAGRGRSEPPPDLQILVIGDSITAGTIAGGGTPCIDQLAARLPSRIRVLNVSKPGTSMWDWTTEGELFRERVLPVLAAGNIAAAVVMLGTNDATPFMGKTHPAFYELDMRKVLGVLLSAGVPRVYLGTEFRRCSRAEVSNSKR